MMDIDWPFIEEREGGNILKGYVPDPETSQSGVTIAAGVDLGQITSTALVSLPDDLRALIQPYRGFKRQDAVIWLAKHPLFITAEQAEVLNQAVRAPLMRALAFHFEQPHDLVFETIPPPCQTVIASVTWQYGNPWERCPKFWTVATVGDWHAVYNELRNFGDPYHSRRELEAAYLFEKMGWQ